jgi:hypothetical protein
MSRLVQAAVLAVVLTVAAGRGAAQDCAPPPAVAYYAAPAVAYTPPPAPAVSYYYTPPAVSYYAAPAVSYYTAPAVSYYAAPAVSYYAPAYSSETVTRYGLFGRPRVTRTYYGP